MTLYLIKFRNEYNWLDRNQPVPVSESLRLFKSRKGVRKEIWEVVSDQIKQSLDKEKLQSWYHRYSSIGKIEECNLDKNKVRIHIGIYRTDTNERFVEWITEMEVMQLGIESTGEYDFENAIFGYSE